MSALAFPAPALPCLPVLGGQAGFPVHRIYCVGRNFADHAREMGAPVERGTPTIFMKPADAAWLAADVPYPPGTADLHHEVEMVLALGRDAGGPIRREEALEFVYAHGVGLDLTRRDLQAVAKEKRLPWDVAKGFDASAPVSPLRPVAGHGHPGPDTVLSLEVNGELRQRSTLGEMLFGVEDILVHLSGLFRLRAGDLVFMGTPAGVAALQRGDRFHARLEGVAELAGRIV